jgi:branched-chain amino acid transport system substrate-binding protein
MAHAVVEHMKKQGVKTVGFLGYTDAYGQAGWPHPRPTRRHQDGRHRALCPRRHQRDPAQALKLTAANPDAMLVVASGSGAAMPHNWRWSSAATRARSTRPMPPPHLT